MKDDELNRKECLKQQTYLRKIIEKSDNINEIFGCFINQHSILHSSVISKNKFWSFEDTIFEDTTETILRRIPHNCHHSILWNIWHIARIEDVTVNILIAGSKQVLNCEEWNKKMEIEFRDTGNSMKEEEIKHLSERINIKQLRKYRLKVGMRTQEIISQLGITDLKREIEQNSLQRIMEEGALVEEASSIKEYWGKRNIAGLMLMPATRHNIIHLNEAFQLKQRKK